jgi:hypothetical protein
MINKVNDYAIAKALNKYVLDLLRIFNYYQIIGPRQDFDLEEINQLYVLLVHELQKLYKNNQKLSSIKYEPIWKHIDYIKSGYETQKYLEEYDWTTSNLHSVEVDRLFIVSRAKEPSYSHNQQELVNSTEAIITKYITVVLEEIGKLPTVELPNWWYIPEYILTYKLDGSILINNALRLKRVHAGSTTERLLEQALKSPNKLFKPNLGKTERNLSTVLSSAGFTPTLRALFFPTVSNDKGVLFRNSVTHSQALAERINTAELDRELIKAGVIPELVPDDDSGLEQTK